MFSKKSNIAFIGAGKIAYSLIPALIETGYKINSVISRNKNSAKRLAEKNNIPLSSGNLKILTNETKIFFLTVPDNQIEKTAKAISKLYQNSQSSPDFQNSLFIHVSGALTIEELKSLKKKDAYTASFHIMQTFPSKEIVNIRKCSVAIEAEDKTVKIFLNRLALDLKLKPFNLNSDKKIYYHLAGVFASNFLVGNLSSAKKMFELTESKKNFFSVINSTLNSTLNNIKNAGPVKALSGPVERGDYETVASHIKLLKKLNTYNSGSVLISYLSQSLLLLNVSKYKNRSLNGGQKKIKKVLIKELESLKKI